MYECVYLENHSLQGKYVNIVSQTLNYMLACKCYVPILGPIVWQLGTKKLKRMKVKRIKFILNFN